MHRLQQRCFLASIGLHVLLMSLLVIGPAFLAPKAKPAPEVPPIDFIPVKTIEALISGGGNPNANSAPPAAVVQPPAPTPPPEVRPAPAPTPKPKPPPEPEPEPPKIRNSEPDPEAFERPKPERKKHQIVASTTVVKRDTDKDSKEKERKQKEQKERERARRAEAEEQERAEKAAAEATAAWRRGLASAIAQSATVVGNGLKAGGTSVELRGPGGGGLPYAGFLQAVHAAYDRAWILPESVSNDATVVASVTIARDGTIVSAYITRRSGNRDMDRSVQTALDRVKTIGVGLPDTARESQRTVEVVFDAKSKRMIG